MFATSNIISTTYATHLLFALFQKTMKVERNIISKELCEHYKKLMYDSLWFQGYYKNGKKHGTIKNFLVQTRELKILNKSLSNHHYM